MTPTICSTRCDFDPNALPIYTTQIDQKVWPVVSRIFDYTIFAFHTFFHKLVGMAVCPKSIFNPIEFNVSHLEGDKVERSVIKVDGSRVDVVVVKKADAQAKWNIIAGGNGEGINAHRRYQPLAQELGGNTIYFDYHGLGSRTKLVNAARAVMRYVEHQGARQITAVGASLGGGVLREAYTFHYFDPEKHQESRYAFVGERTFSTVYDVVKTKMGPICANLVHCFGWNLASSTHPFEFELGVQEKWDGVIRENAWFKTYGQKGFILTDSQAHQLCQAAHIYPLYGQYPEIAERVNAFFASK